MWLPSPFRALAWVCVQQCVSLWAGRYSSFPWKDSFTCVQHLLRQDSTGWRWAGRRCRLESKEVIALNHSYFSWQTPGSKTPIPSQQSPSARIVLSGLALPLSTWVTSPLMLLGGYCGFAFLHLAFPASPLLKSPDSWSPAGATPAMKPGPLNV